MREKRGFQYFEATNRTEDQGLEDVFGPREKRTSGYPEESGPQAGFTRLIRKVFQKYLAGKISQGFG